MNPKTILTIGIIYTLLCLFDAWWYRNEISIAVAVIVLVIGVFGSIIQGGGFRRKDLDDLPGY